MLTLKTMIPPEAEQLLIRRVTPRTQEIDLHNGARLTAELIEGTADKLTMVLQEITEQKTAKDDDNEVRQNLNLTIEELEDKKQDKLPDEENPLITGNLKINEFYIPSNAHRYIVTQSWFNEAPRPLKPGRYIITDGI